MNPNVFVDGERKGYPSLEHFDSEGIKYIQERAKSATNHLLKARYNQVLWNSELKHHKYAKASINEYLKYLEYYDLTVRIGKERLFYDMILINSFSLATKVNHRRQDHFTYFDRLFDIVDEKAFYLQLSVINFFASQKQVYTDYLQKAESILLQAYERCLNKLNHYLGNIVVSAAISVSSKLGKSVAIWHTRMGALYEAFGDFRKQSDETGIIAFDMYKAAISCYKQGGDEEAFKNAAIKYEAQKSNLKLSQVRIPLDNELVELLLQYQEKRAKKLSERSSTEIYDYLVFGEDIFPNIKALKIMDNKQWVHETLYRKIEFDINKNATKRNSEHDAILNEKQFKRYNLEVNISTLQFLYSLFFSGVHNGKISYESLINYITQYSFIGKELEEVNTTGETRTYIWLDVLKPSLLSFFNDLDISIKTGGLFTPNYQLVIDSMVLKFEGILRDIVKRLGVNTVKVVREETREMYTEDLLRDAREELSKFYNDTDLLLFYYVFTKRGINLRNDISHCYFKLPTDYGVSMVYLILISLLRLGKRSIQIS